MERLRWVLAAAIAALACHLAVQPTTPIDLALPFLALLVTLLAWASYPTAMIAVPLLIAAEVALPDEQMRLLAFGAIMAAVAAQAIGGLRLSSRASSEGPGRVGAQGMSLMPPTRPAPLIAVATILLLRWIPIHDVLIGRELFLLAIAVAIVFVLGRAPFAIMVAVITALVTPAVPLRTLALPLLVLAVATAARTLGMPALKLTWPSTIVVAFAVLSFAWSGVAARVFPYFLKQATAPKERVRVTQALAPNESVTLDVPPGARSLIISGANVARLRRGAPLGRLESEGMPGGLTLRIGDAADWGYTRREQFYAARNLLPRDPAGAIRGYGYNAWLDGAGRVALPAGARQIRVIADAALPPNAALQVEGFE